ncbi:MAG: Ig-like domain-containing protein, partial [Chloroflexales bacterium]
TICSATVAADGTWSCTATTDMANGAHTISVTQIDAAGNSSAGVTRSITIDALYRFILPMINV